MRNHSKTAALTGIAAGALLVLGGTAQAYGLDTTTGVGFVGKGEVQTAFGWNNAALQANASGVTFSYEATEGTVPRQPGARGHVDGGRADQLDRRPPRRVRRSLRPPDPHGVSPTFTRRESYVHDP